jgi:response regulator RpfG family c-di-GMP phosphodiesterase
MERILFVDDDETILRGFQRNLGFDYDLEIATGGSAALELIEKHGAFPVVISDMRMPGMDGTQFLSLVRESWPDSVRILLTGQADFSDAVAVVNEGQIFRFLTKPCPLETIKKSIEDGLNQYRLITAEKELLNRTLKGAIKLLIDMMSVVNPDAFSQSVRVRKLVNELAVRLNLENAWQADIAALLSQIGCVTIPADILQKKYKGYRLDEEESVLYGKRLQIGKDLLSNIPRLEEVAAAIEFQDKAYNGDGPPAGSVKGKEIPVIARILKVAHDFDNLLTKGQTRQHACRELANNESCYDPDILAALDAEVSQVVDEFVVKEINAKSIRTGMILAEDVKSKSGLLLVAGHQEISDTLKLCVLNFAYNNNVIEPIKVFVEKSATRVV